jgi:ribosomal protein S18 acetylase RimI-like enzyme
VSPPFRLEPLTRHHARDSFRSGDEALDRYLQTLAMQDIKRRVANCFVAVESSSELIAGFYTIAAASVLLNELPTNVRQRLPRYPTIPAVRIGRLAVDRAFQKRGLGGALLADAVVRTMQSPAAAFTLVVDAKNDAAVAFYEHHGFRRFESQPRTLFLPLGTAVMALTKPT